MAFDLTSLDTIPVEVIPAAILGLSARLLSPPAPTQAQATARAAPLLTAAEMAERLHIHESAVRTLEREGKIPGVRIGRYVRFRAEDVEAALARESG
jgi:excisionase family DNA binding protein